MAHLYRFFTPGASPSEGEILLPPEEAHHALHVARLSAGEPVQLFDGSGTEWDGIVVAATRRGVTVARAAERRGTPPEPELRLLLGWPHRAKTVEEIIRRGTELDVNRFVFFRAERSERTPQDDPRWLKYAIETCKQCGRNWLPTFTAAGSIEEAMAAASGLLLAALPRGPHTPWTEAAGGEAVTLLVGPEGGFTENEEHTIDHRGGRRVSLGASILRSEVAATVAVTIVRFLQGRLGPRE